MIGKTNAISGVAPVPKIRTVSGSVISISDALAMPAVSLVADINAVQSGSGDPSPSNVRPISGWSAVNVYREAQYNAGATPYATINLNGTVYGGSLDVTTGVLTVDMAMYTFTGNEAWTLQSGSYGGIKYYSTQYLLRNVAKLPADNFKSVPIITSIGSFDYPYNSLHVHPNAMCIAADGRIGIEGGLYNSSGDTLKDIQLVYELATPQTVQLTPTQVQMLLGNNTLWADSGDSELQYWARR